MRNVKTVPPSPTYRHLTMSCSTYPTLNAMSLELVSMMVNSRLGEVTHTPVRARNRVARPSARRWPSKSCRSKISQPIFASVDGMPGVLTIWPSTTSRSLSRISSAMLRDASSSMIVIQSAFPRVGSCVGGGFAGKLTGEHGIEAVTMSGRALHTRNSRHVFRGDACGANLRTGRWVGPQPGEVWRCEHMSPLATSPNLDSAFGIWGLKEDMMMHPDELFSFSLFFKRYTRVSCIGIWDMLYVILSHRVISWRPFLSDKSLRDLVQSYLG